MGWVILIFILSPDDITKSRLLLRSITRIAPVLLCAIFSQAFTTASILVSVGSASCLKKLKCFTKLRLEAKLVEPIINKNFLISC